MTFKPDVIGGCDLKKGIVTTKRYWEQPINKKFDEWVILVKEYINTHRIEVNMYVCGKFLENPELTWDVDVILSYPGEIDYVLIRNLMNYGMQLGFDKFDMLVDMAFYIPFDKEGTFWYSSEDYKKYGTIECKTLHTFDKTEYNGEIIHEFESCEQIMENLFVVSQTAPSEKHIKRIENGEMYMKPVLI